MGLMYLEIDSTTGEQRLHTEESLLARLAAIRLTQTEARNVMRDVHCGLMPDAGRSWLRIATALESATVPFAMQSGAWGPGLRSRKHSRG